MVIEFYGGPFDGQRSEVPDLIESILLPVQTQIAYGPAQMPTPTRGPVARYRKTDMVRTVVERIDCEADLVYVCRRFDYEGTF